MFSNIENSQKGISLILTFFIMTIILAIVLGVGAILVSEIKIIRAMGNSVVAFYAADSGIEKTLYFERKKPPEGICNICTECLSPDCESCTTSGNDCDPMTCADCEVSYYTEFNGKKYEVEAIVVSRAEFETTIKSFGDYKETTRAIELTFTSTRGGSSGGPIISNTFVDPRSVPVGITLSISADISDSDGLAATGDARPFAHIQYPDETDIATVLLIPSGGDGYSVDWSGSVGVYYVDITACDILGNCSEAENI